MASKNNYPRKRNPAKKVTCPECGNQYHARGIKPHLKMTHGFSYIEIQNFFIKHQITGAKNIHHEKEIVGHIPDQEFAEQVATLLKELSKAYQNNSKVEVEGIIERIALVRHRMAWSIPDIESESLRLSKNYFIPEGTRAEPSKRLVVMLSDGTTRDVDSRDYIELSFWIEELKSKRAGLKNRIERFRHPVLRQIESELSS